MAVESYLKDLLLIIKDKEEYKNQLLKKYSDELSSFQDLLGDNQTDMSLLFYCISRNFLYMLDNNPDISIKKSDVDFRRKFYKVLKLIGPFMLGCTQVIEDRQKFSDGVDESLYKQSISEKPVIYVSNHGLRDDALATMLAANRHAYIYWGSLPLFYNTIDGLASSLVGEVIVNRKSKSSKQSSILKANKVMEYGADLIIYPEGGWNKTSEKLCLDLWRGVYKISSIGECDVVPIVHYTKNPEIVNKKNIIHTIVDKPIALYQYSEKDALLLLRDILASWQYKMMEVYGKSTRKKEMENFVNSDDRWDELIKQRMSVVSRYDSAIEKNSDYRSKDIVRPEDVFKTIAQIKNITPYNIKMIQQAKTIVKTRENNDFQRKY